ncbi:DNA-directed RNA polymerase subunit beta, partial [Acidithiobacillus sp. GGI-221]
MRALGYSTQDILEMFFDMETFRLIDGDLRYVLIPQRLQGEVAAFDIVSPETGDVLVQAGKRITVRQTKALSEVQGLHEIPVPDSFLLGKVVARDIVHPETGEVVVQANEPVSGELLDALRKMPSLTLHTLYLNELDRGPYISETLRIDTSRDAHDAQMEIYRLMR